MTGPQAPRSDDVIQARSRAQTEKLERQDARLALAPDEATVPSINDAQQSTRAELIRQMTASYEQRRAD